MNQRTLNRARERMRSGAYDSGAIVKKRYLGDAVYVEVVNGMLKLTTENGIEETNCIYLEPQVMSALEEYWKEAKSKRS